MYIKDRFHPNSRGKETPLPYHHKKKKPHALGAQVNLVDENGHSTEEILYIRDISYEYHQNALRYSYLLVRKKSCENLSYSAAPQPKRLFWDEVVGWYCEDKFVVVPDVLCDSN